MTAGRSANEGRLTSVFGVVTKPIVATGFVATAS
jgi:hypothetical protein